MTTACVQEIRAENSSNARKERRRRRHWAGRSIGGSRKEGIQWEAARVNRKRGKGEERRLLTPRGARLQQVST